MKYIDTHCHLDFPDYYTEDGEEIKSVLERMKEKEVGAITIGTDLESSKRAVKIAEEGEKTGNKIWACVGVHPEKPQGEILGFEEKEFEKLIQSPKVVAIGECGLDWFRIAPENMDKERERQVNLFRQQIEFAIKHNKPLMLHCRNSYDDVLDILEKYKGAAGPEVEKLKGNAHFFAGNIEQAKRFLDIGFTMSFTGVITFAHDYDEVIKYIPQDSIMSETDAPFVAPVPYRGKRNEPSFVIEVVKKLAEIKGVTEEEIRDILLKNAKRVFGI